VPRLSDHFTDAELNRDGAPLSPLVRSNLIRTANGLERIRAIAGRPLMITSGYRTPTKNAAVGGAEGSDHTMGLAADFVPNGISSAELWAAILRDVQRIGDFDQLIYYPKRGHIHEGYGSRNRRQLMTYDDNHGYRVIAGVQNVSAFAPEATQAPSGGTGSILHSPKLPTSWEGLLLLIAGALALWLIRQL